MRITIETGTNPHSIKVEGHYTMDELIKFLSKYYPDFTWKDVIICEELPKMSQGLWGQIKDTNRHQYVPTPWPGSTGSSPYIGDIITGTGTTGSGTTYTTNQASTTKATL